MACRRAFAGPKHDRCPTVYLRADSLEKAVRTEAARVLANPTMVLAEAERLRNQGIDHEALAVQDSALKNLDNRRGRLLKLYEMGEIDDEYFLQESNSLRVEKAKVEELRGCKIPVDLLPQIDDLEQACQRIQDWVLSAEGEDLALLLDALQVQVHVENGRGELKGIIPEYAPKNGHADVCSMVINSRM